MRAHIYNKKEITVLFGYFFKYIYNSRMYFEILFKYLQYVSVVRRSMVSCFNFELFLPMAAAVALFQLTVQLHNTR